MTLQLIIDSKFNSAGVREAEKQVLDLAKNIGTQMQAQGPGNFLENQLGTINDGTIAMVKERIAQVNQLAEAYKNAAVQQYSLGNVAIGDKLSSYSNSLRSSADNMQALTGATEKNVLATETQGGVLDFINNKFNKFAFGLFVVQGAIGTVTRLIGQMTDALIEGASIADRSNAFNVLLEDVGVNAEAVKAQLIGASQGAITLDAAMRPTIQLMKAGVPEVANMSGKLLEMAVASAKLSGDLGQTEEIYTTLVRGIVRGSPRLIDNADIYLKLGDANERYAESIGKTVEQLSAQDKIIATALAVEEQGDSIIELAEKVDSTAITFQNLATDAKEAGQILLSEFSTGAGAAIEALQDLFVEYVTLQAAVQGFRDEQLTAWKDLAEAFANNPFSTFVESVIVGATFVVESIKFLIQAFSDLNNAVIQTSQMGAKAIDIFFKVASGSITAADGLAQLKAVAVETANALADGLDPSQEWEEAMGNVSDRAREAAINIGLISPEMEGLGATAEQEANRVSDAFNDLSAGIQAAIEARTGIDAQFADKREGIEEDLADKIKDINEDLAKRLADISSGLKDKLIEINEKYKEDVINLSEDTAEELQSIDEDLADKLADATETATKSREDAYKDRNKGIEDAQEKHQQKLLDIERRYEAARMKALIDRDARALFEAEQARAQGRDEANEDLDDQLKDEEDKLKEKIDKINELEEERRSDAIEAAEKRRKDALEAQAKELQDLKDNFAKQKQEATKAANESRQDAIRSANEKRRDAQEHYRDSLQDLDEWYQEQLMLQKERQLQEKIRELEHLNEMGELTQDHINELKGMWNDYNGFVSGSTGGGGTSSVGGMTGGGASTQAGSSTGGGGTLSGITGGGTPNVGDWSNWTGPNGLTLNIKSNDQTLQDVLRSGTYEYMLEALNE